MRIFPSIAAVCLLAAPFAAGEQIASSVKLSQPDKPGTVRIAVGQGSVKVVPNDTGDTITVSSDAEPEKPQPTRADGLRVLSTGGGSFSLTEKNNVVELEYGRDTGPATPGEDFLVAVPRNVSVQIVDSWTTDVQISDITGDVEVKTMQGEIKLSNLSGGALVETMNGEIDASFTAVSAGKPLSFTSMNGEITLHLPEDAQGNVRLRTQNGSILTDFPEDRLKTKTESAHASAARQSEAARIAGEAAREAARVAREVAAEVRQAVNEATSDGPRPPRPPRPPSIPSMVGGKVIAGALNGGGTDIQAATMNGDIVLRRRK
jgi:hypothetical protein